MKKIIFIVAALFILIGCSDTPPEPGSGSAIGEAIGYLPNNDGGYAPPYDVNDNNIEIFSINHYSFEVLPGQKTISQLVNVNLDKGFVYRYGMYSTKNGWVTFEFSDQGWIKNQASKVLEINVDDLEEENYILTYSCKKYKKDWKCGCDEHGNCGMWMLQKYYVENGQAGCTSDSDCGEVIQKTLCSDDSSCTITSSPRCLESGISNAYCGYTNESDCTPCSFGCNDETGYCNPDITCTDECEFEGDTVCKNSTNLLTCGNFDQDHCLEWKEYSCPSYCNGGECIDNQTDICSDYIIDIMNVSNNKGNLDISYRTVGAMSQVSAYLYYINGSIVFNSNDCSALGGGCGASSGSEYASCSLSTDCAFPDFSYYDRARVELFGSQCNTTDWMTIP